MNKKYNREKRLNNFFVPKTMYHPQSELILEAIVEYFLESFVRKLRLHWEYCVSNQIKMRMQRKYIFCHRVEIAANMNILYQRTRYLNIPFNPSNLKNHTLIYIIFLVYNC